MTDEALVETSARRVDADGVPILVVSFVGKYGYGCEGNGDARKMAEDVEAILAAHEDAEAVVFDGTRLWYKWGDEIGRVSGGGRPWVWAVSEETSGLVSYVAAEMAREPSEWLFPSVEEAIAAARARVVAEVTELHGADGALCERWQREPRGRRELSFDERGRVVLETLYARAARIVERIGRDESGAVKYAAEWPFPDARGGRNEACRIGARLVFEAGELRTIDFTPWQTGGPLPADWLSRIEAHTTLRELILDDTSVSDGEVAELLARCPGLERLSLNGVRLEGAFLAPPSRAGRLRDIGLFNGSVPAHVARAFARENPRVNVGYDEMYEKAG